MNIKKSVRQGLVTVALAGSLIFIEKAGAAANPIHWSIVSVPENPLAPGTKFVAKLLSQIDPGWHLYALNEEEGGPVPTEISLPAQSVLTLDAIRASKSMQLLDANFNKRVNLYVEKAEFGLPLTIAEDAPAGRQQTSILVRYQCCNQSMCLPPRTASIDLSIFVKAKR